MAGVHTYQQLGESVAIFAIDHSVGIGGRNLVDDVQLIQVLINRYIDWREEIVKDHPGERGFDARVLDKSGRTIARLAVDGNCGPRTRAAIVATQRSLNKWRSSAVDGRIDAIDEGGKSQYQTGRVEFWAGGVQGGKIVKTPIMQTRFNTMYILAEATEAEPGSRSWDNSSMPEPLRSALFRSWARGFAKSVP
jgi:hypothetical protein